MSAPSHAELDRLALAFADLVARAGAIAMETLAAPNIAARLKNDTSPVCEADEKIEALLLAELALIAPGVPIVAEEASARGEQPRGGSAFLLVDPLDGTREFLARRGEFTVNIGLVVEGVPRAGAVFAPALGELWFAGATAYGATAAPGASAPPPDQWRRLAVRKIPPQGPVALVSRSHLDEETRAFLQRHGVTDLRETGSSVKFCRLAEGAADLYPRFGPTMEWDTAAGDAVLRAAGGAVLEPSGRPLLYGKADAGYRNGPFIALGDPAAASFC